MTVNTTVAIADRDLKQFVGGITPVNISINVSDITSGAITNGDQLKLCTLPANAKVIGLQARLTGTSGITGLAEFRILEPTANTISLSATTLAPSVAFVALLTQPHTPITSTTGTRDLQLACSSGSFSTTVAAAKLLVDIQYAFFP